MATALTPCSMLEQLKALILKNVARCECALHTPRAGIAWSGPCPLLVSLHKLIAADDGSVGSEDLRPGGYQALESALLGSEYDIQCIVTGTWCACGIATSLVTTRAVIRLAGDKPPETPPPSPPLDGVEKVLCHQCLRAQQKLRWKTGEEPDPRDKECYCDLCGHENCWRSRCEMSDCCYSEMSDEGVWGG